MELILTNEAINQSMIKQFNSIQLLISLIQITEGSAEELRRALLKSPE